MATITPEEGSALSPAEVDEVERLGIEAEARIMAQLAESQAEWDRRAGRIRVDAKEMSRAFRDWEELTTDADWEARQEDAVRSYESGRYLIERLGGARFLDPDLMTVLWALRNALIAEHDIQDWREMILVDMVVLAYYNALRVQGWIGNFALSIETHAFGQPSPTTTLERRYGKGHVPRLLVEETFQRMSEQILPLLDRCNRMLIRNLKALRDLRTATVPVNLANYGQVNIGQHQSNSTGSNAAASTETVQMPPAQRSRRRKRSNQ